MGKCSGGKHAICDRVQLLSLAKACKRFLMCAVLSVSVSLSKSITFSKEGRGWKVGGTVTRLGGHSPRMPPLGTSPGFMQSFPVRVGGLDFKKVKSRVTQSLKRKKKLTDVSSTCLWRSHFNVSLLWGVFVLVWT